MKRINQLISNAASHLVRSPLNVQTKNVAVGKGRLVIVVTVPKGNDKPYFDENGVIWLKVGADKRRVNSKEELRRLFQVTDQFHADELPTKADIDKLDKLRFRDFLRDVYKQEFPVPDNLTVEKIRVGNSNIRNPILVSYVAKGLLPYHGLGSGIKRALDVWPQIDFVDDRDGCLFTATVHRTPVEELILAPGLLKSSEKSSEKIIAIIRENPEISAGEIASRIGITQRAVEKQVAALKKAGRLRRVGPAKGGHWEIPE